MIEEKLSNIEKLMDDVKKSQNDLFQEVLQLLPGDTGFQMKVIEHNILVSSVMIYLESIFNIKHIDKKVREKYGKS